jgi:hypothetical protein
MVAVPQLVAAASWFTSTHQTAGDAPSPIAKRVIPKLNLPGTDKVTHTSESVDHSVLSPTTFLTLIRRDEQPFETVTVSVDHWEKPQATETIYATVSVDYYQWDKAQTTETVTATVTMDNWRATTTTEQSTVTEVIESVETTTATEVIKSVETTTATQSFTTTRYVTPTTSSTLDSDLIASMKYTQTGNSAPTKKLVKTVRTTVTTRVPDHKTQLKTSTMIQKTIRTRVPDHSAHPKNSKTSMVKFKHTHADELASGTNIAIPAQTPIQSMGHPKVQNGDTVEKFALRARANAIDANLHDLHVRPQAAEDVSSFHIHSTDSPSSCIFSS